MKTKTYRVICSKDEDGYWLARVEGVEGCHTQGRSLATALERVPEALEVCDVDPKQVKLEPVFVVPGVPVKRLAKKMAASKRRADQAQAAAQRAQKDAVSELLKRVSHRDAAAILGMSHQRIQQLAKDALR